MPFASKKQRAFLYAKHPDVAKEFAEKTSAKDEKELPMYSDKHKKKKHQADAIKRAMKK